MPSTFCPASISIHFNSFNTNEFINNEDTEYNLIHRTIRKSRCWYGVQVGHLYLVPCFLFDDACAGRDGEFRGRGLAYVLRTNDQQATKILSVSVAGSVRVLCLRPLHLTASLTRQPLAASAPPVCVVRLRSPFPAPIHTFCPCLSHNSFAPTLVGRAAAVERVVSVCILARFPFPCAGKVGSDCLDCPQTGIRLNFGSLKFEAARRRKDKGE